MQWSSNLSVHQNHLGGLLRQITTPALRVGCSSPGAGLRTGISASCGCCRSEGQALRTTAEADATVRHPDSLRTGTEGWC